MSKERYIVRGDGYNVQGKGLYLMKGDDFRLPKLNTICKATSTLDKKIVRGLSVRVYKGDNGKNYFVFSDWSVAEAEQ